jgi:DNA topoisomerase I
MAKNLMIVESPGKIKKLKEILGPGWDVQASVGHIKDLPRGEMGVDFVSYKAGYELTERGKEVVSRLRARVKEASEIYIATDPDREGEAIAGHLRDALKLKKYKRVAFGAITQGAVKGAIESPKGLDEKMIEAQEARRVLDRLVGYKVSPVLSQQTGIKGLSAGRVQSVAVRLVVELEKEIANFKEVNHFGAEVEFSGPWTAEWDTTTYLSDSEKYILDEALAKEAAACRVLKVISMSTKDESKAPNAPYITSSLIKDASAKLNMKPSAVMQTAQTLYEGGHITYHRTDSFNMSPEGIAAVRGWAKKNGLAICEPLRVWKNKESAQEGHEAIRPAHIDVVDIDGTEKEKALYGLIRNRAIVSQLKDAVYHMTRLVLTSEREGRVFTFTASGKAVTFPGWTAYISGPEDESDEKKDDQNNVPALKEGTVINAESGKVLSKKTKPPKRFTQASLVDKLERLGIGRPSTYAAIMQNILNKSYILEDGNGKSLKAGAPGVTVVNCLNGNFKFMDYGFTKELEEGLDAIASGKKQYRSVVAPADEGLNKELQAIGAGAVGAFKCPQCGKSLRRIPGKNGFFWGCEGYKSGCKYTASDVGGEPKKNE